MIEFCVQQPLLFFLSLCRFLEIFVASIARELVSSFSPRYFRPILQRHYNGYYYLKKY